MTDNTKQPFGLRVQQHQCTQHLQILDYYYYHYYFEVSRVVCFIHIYVWEQAVSETSVVSEDVQSVPVSVSEKSETNC